MEFFKDYLRERRGAIGCFLLSAALFLAFFALWRLPLAAVLYPAAIVALVWLLFALLRVRRAKERHAAMTRAAALPANQVEGALPPARSLAERDDRAVIGSLCRECAETVAAQERLLAETVDSFTLWAHQIKTPIAAMALTLQGEDSPLQRALRGDLTRIEQYVEMALVLLRLDSADTDYVFAPCSLDALARGAVKRFSAEFIARRLRLDYRVEDRSVLTDEKWLSFVLEQLLSNALKYTPEGSISIYTEGESLCVSDTGMGIAPDELPRVFEKGYTGSMGRRDKSASGLGLWLCRRVCTRLGHSLTLESEPGKGTTARIGLERPETRPE